MTSPNIESLAEHFIGKSRHAFEHEAPTARLGKGFESLRETLLSMPEVIYAVVEVMSFRLAGEFATQAAHAPVGSGARQRLVAAATINNPLANSLTIFMAEHIASLPVPIHADEILQLTLLISQRYDSVETLVDFADAIVRVEALTRS